MRLDVYLKASRLVLRRPLVKELCEAGKILVNDLTTKPGKDIRIGDRITVIRTNARIEVEVAALPAAKQVAKADASALYSVIRETSGDDELL